MDDQETPAEIMKKFEILDEILKEKKNTVQGVFLYVRSYCVGKK